MNVLVLNFEKTWRGGERQTLYNMQGFEQVGMDVTLACRENTPMAIRAREAGFKVRDYKNVFGVIGFLLSKGSSYDVIHVQTSHMLTYAAYTKPFHGTKVVFTRRVNFQPSGFFTRLKYQLSDSIIAISQSVKRVLHNFGIREVQVISDIVVPKVLDVARAKKEFGDLVRSKKVVATMAALSKDKDPGTTVAAIKQLSEKRDDFIFLHFGDGDMKEEVQEKINALGLQDVYKLVGFQEQVEDFFSILDVFVLTSEQEGLGSIVLDAFAYKVPVAATRAGGLAELTDEGRGVSVDIKDASAVAMGINSLLDNQELTNSISNKAYNYVIDNHSMAAITEKYKVLFDKL